MKYSRSRNDIVSGISEAVNQGSRSVKAKRRIMYKLFLSYAQLIQFMKLVEQSRLLQCDEDGQGHNLSEKGVQALDMSKQLVEMARSHIPVLAIFKMVI
jgi:predicted transcriptional regulator